MTIYRFQVEGGGWVKPKLIEAGRVHTALHAATELVDLKRGQELTLKVTNLGPVEREKPLFSVGDVVEFTAHTGERRRGEVVHIRAWHGRLTYTVKYIIGSFGSTYREPRPADKLTRVAPEGGG